MRLFQKKRNYKICIVLLFFVALLIQAPFSMRIETSNNENSRNNPQLSVLISRSQEWLNNNGFNTTDDWYNKSITDISNPDVNSSISNGLANFEVMGNNGTFSLIVDPNNSTELAKWSTHKKSEFVLLPETTGIIYERGFYASHEWDEGDLGGQDNNTPAVRWKRDIAMPIDMSDYEITSASIYAEFNATVEADGLWTGGIEVPNDYTEADDSPYQPQNDTLDYVRFNVEISNLAETLKYEIGYNQTRYLGDDDEGDAFNMHSYPDTEMEYNVGEEILTSYLESVLSDDFIHFRMILGIDIYCADNYRNSDEDNWDTLLIRYVNLTFNYEKKINEYASISWNQDCNNVSSLSPYPVVATGANLRFQYRIDKNWSIYTPKKNSELNVYLNGNPYPIPIKLIDINDTAYEWAEIDLTPPASNDGVNLSIEVLIRDEFSLDQIITISIDNVTLDIYYTIFAPDPVSSDGGGGGGTKIIRGEDYSWLVYTLTAGIMGIVIAIAAYEKHYKYPPMVRKIRKLKKKIRKGKKVKTLLVDTREQLIKDNFKSKTHQILEAEITQPEINDKLKKGGT
ncbi:MAG: hypothetical protein EU533_05690 [Promethearchaeota archaeon]|nr:MAG: hypothetical protein EU533_05690 [Candidatus Lokiarchaeota archaeon]